MKLNIKKGQNIGDTDELKFSSIEMLENRVNSIPKLVQGKKVLSIGCVDMVHSIAFEELIKLGNHQFYNMSKTASELIGIDVNRNGIQQLTNKSLNVKYFDIFSDTPSSELKEKFDYVVVSHVIEHIPNCYEFMQKIIEKFDFDKIIIAVPNALSTISTRRSFFKQEVVSNDHYYTFSPITLVKLMESLPLNIETLCFDQINKKWIPRIELGKNKPILGFLNNIRKVMLWKIFDNGAGDLILIASKK